MSGLGRSLEFANGRAGVPLCRRRYNAHAAFAAAKPGSRRVLALLIVLGRFMRAFRYSLADPEFRALVGIVAMLLGIGTLFYTRVEGWHWFDSLYFSVVTLATVGYGDLTPQTTLGKLFTMIYIFMGIGVLVSFASKIVQAMVTTREQRQSSHDNGSAGTSRTILPSRREDVDGNSHNMT